MAEFKIKDKETGEVFTVRDKEDSSKVVSSTNNSKAAFRQGLVETAKGVGRAFAGQGISEFIPGMESNITKKGVEASTNLGQQATDAMGVSKTPNAKFAGLNINPNSVASGLIGGALDPRSLASLGTLMPGMAMEQAGIQASRPGAMMIKSRGAMKQAEKLTTQMLQPTTSELAESIMRGRQLPSIKRGAENIISAKTYDEVVGHLKNTTKELFDERNLILQEHNAPVGTEAFNSLDELIKDASKNKLMSPGKMKIMDNVYSREADFLAENPTMDVATAQARKEKLQDLTRPLLEKRAKGGLSGSENVELQAYDALRSGYRKAILKALPKDKAVLVDKINSKYEGLVDATELASKQLAEGMKEIPKTVLDKVAASFGLSPQYTAIRLAVKEAARVIHVKTGLERTTSKIEMLRNKAETLKHLAILAKKATRKN